jgi:hypothetical protein
MKCTLAYVNHAGAIAARRLHVECATSKHVVAWNTAPTNMVVARGTLACITASVHAPCHPDVAWIRCEIGVTHGPIDQTIVQAPFLWRITANCQYHALIVGLCVTVHMPVLHVTPTYDTALSLMRLGGAHTVTDCGEDPDTELDQPEPASSRPAYLCTC